MSTQDRKVSRRDFLRLARGAQIYSGKKAMLDVTSASPSPPAGGLGSASRVAYQAALRAQSQLGSKA